MIAGTAAAANINAFPPVMPVNQAEAAGARNIMRAPLNPNLDKGTKIFGYTTVDYDGVKNFVNFYSSTPRNLDKFRQILIPDNHYDEDFPRLVALSSGCWAGDAYYAYRHFHYTFSTGVIGWAKIDPKTGVAQELCDMNDTFGSTSPSWWSMSQATLWNPNKPEDLYVLAQSKSGNVSSVIHKIDRANGVYGEKVVELPNYYFSAAYDYDNNIYALTWKFNAKGDVTGTLLHVISPEEDYEIISEQEIKVDGQPWLIYYDNNMTIDYSTGDIWWAAASSVDYKRTLVKIDPKSGATESFGAFGIDDHIGGMYIEYQTAEKRNAPARVSKPSFTIDPQGANKVTLNWTNPSTYWNRNTMKNLSSVEIYRDAYPGTPIATLTATGQEGKAMSYTDEGASKGIHTYYFVAVNPNGKGVPFQIDAFVGTDVPGPVNALGATSPEGKTINISWEKPTRGDNDGWFNDSDLTYNITRLPDNKNLGTTKETRFTDNTLGDAMLYSYVVTASNADGTGSPVESNSVMAGNAVRPPFSTEFQTRVDADRFTTIDVNRDYQTFEYRFNTHLGRDTYGMVLSNQDNQDILVSPALRVEKGKTYKVTFDVFYGGYGDQTTREIVTPCRLVGGPAATAEKMTEVLFDDPDNITSFPPKTVKWEAYFTAPVDGEYYVGFETLVSNEADAWIYIEGFSIDEAPSDDLEARSLDAYLYLSTIEENEIKVEVYNNGDKDQSKYSVKLALLNDDNQPEVFAETSDVPVLKAHETAVVKMSEKMPKSGAFNLVAIVELEGDGNPTNNTTEPLYIQAEDVQPLNYTVTDEDSATKITNIPFNHYSACTTSQTIYTPAMTLLDRVYPDQTPTITRIAWEGKSLASLNEFSDTKITVYIGQTDEAGYSTDDPMFIPVDEDPIFEDMVTLRSGRNYVVADFEEPFAFNPKRALLVTVAKEDFNHADFLFDWYTFDADWYAVKKHTILCSGNEPLDLTDPTVGKMNVYADAPVLHMAIQGKKNSGIGHLVMTGKGAIYVNASTGTVETSFPIASVEVYNFSGQLVENVKVADGATSARLNIENGIYLIKVNGVDGKSQTIKAQL